jgi:hypothetical protein
MLKRRVWPRRYRHPCEKGEPCQRAVGEAFRCLLDSRTWKRHPKPFAKTQRGMERRQARLFVIESKRELVPT